MPCSPVKLNHVSEEHITSIFRAAACCLLHAGFLLGLLFNPEDEGDMFLRNVGSLSMDYRMLHQFSSVRCSYKYVHVYILQLFSANNNYEKKKKYSLR
jgi:hypothetical protein